MTAHRCSALVGLALAVAVALPARAQPVSAEPAAGPEQARGSCRTPREAVYQLLYWIQPERTDLSQAAACLDTAGLDEHAALPDLAYKVKKYLDINAMVVDVDALPRDPAYTDDDGEHRYQLPGASDFVVVQRDDRWLISAATVRRLALAYDDEVPPTIHALVSRAPAWLQRPLPVLDIAGWQLLGLLLLVFVALALQWLTVFAVSSWVRRLTGRLKVGWIDRLAERVQRPVGGLAMAGVFYVGVPWLRFSVRVSQVARLATTVLAVVSIAWLAYRLIDVLCDWLNDKAGHTDTKLDDQLVPLLRKTLKVFTAVIGVIFVLQNLDVDVGSLLAGLGLGGLAFALAAKDTIANFFGSVVIFVDKPFQIGDWIVISGVEGIVEEVGFRTTKVRTFYNSLVTVPNAMLTNAAIDNYGVRQYRRYSTTLGLTYDTTPEKLQAFCEGVRAIIMGLPEMRHDYFMVEFKEFGESSLVVMLYCFFEVPSWNAEMRGRTHLNLEILRLAQELGVSFAFPTRTLHVDTRAEAAPLPARPERSSDQLAAIVSGFGPGGQHARPAGVPLTYGYDCGTRPPEGIPGRQLTVAHSPR